MANSTLAADLTVEQWQKDYFTEYVRGNRFKRYMGTDESMPIQLVDDLDGKPGDTVHIGLVTKLSGAGVTGNQTLEGNEEKANTYEDHIHVDWSRNAVTVDKREARKGWVNLLEKSKPMLKNWSMELLRDTIIEKLGSAKVDGTTAYADCTDAEMDAWLVANSDRVLYGASKSNNAANDHDTCLGTIDSTNDVFTPAILMVAKRMLLDATPAIRPIKIEEDEEFYICFTGKWAFRDFKASAAYQAAAAYAAERGANNPLFRTGDLMWENIIIREIPEIGVIEDQGNGGIDVQPYYLCGAQAIGVGWAVYPTATKEEYDYGFVNGVGIEECKGVKKLMFNNKQHGLFTGFVAGVADT